VRKADNLPSSCAVVMKSGNLNVLGPSGPLQACNGTALSFTFTTSSIFCILVDVPDDGQKRPKHVV